MNHMNMAGINPTGGPVGGIPMMNNGTNGPRGNTAVSDKSRTQLNTYIYDYFLKNELYDCARALVHSDVSLNISNSPQAKTSPGHRRDGDVNGTDENTMDTDSKDDILSKRPDDLPIPSVPSDCPDSSFLFDWWCLFWDIFLAQRRKPKPGEGGPALQYIQHTQQQSRLRQEQQQQMLRQMNPQMIPNQIFNQSMMRGMHANGMMAPNELQRRAVQNNNRNAYVQPTPQQLSQMAKNQQMMQQQMQRDNSDVDINGHPRPQSPSSAENAPSPSKRPRLEGAAINGQQLGPNGRQLQGMQGQQVGNSHNASALQANHLLMQNGINPGALTNSQFNSFQQQNPAVQAKSIQVYAQNLASHQRSAHNQALKGMPNPALSNQGSPMMQAGADSQNLMNEFYAGGVPRMGPNGQGGNHALQDYQMQLMLLEQQNKKRLLMARQEQDSMTRVDGQPGPGAQPGFPPGMSPQNSRAGPSPNPNDQMKRGTPKMGQAGPPGSPLPDGSIPQTRGSPAAMNFNPGQIPQDVPPQFYHQMKGMGENMIGGSANGNVMRPPSSHPQGFSNGQPINQQQFDAMTRSQAGNRVSSGNWQQGPQGASMMQQPSGQPAQPLGTPQQRNAMPPPQAPAAGAASGRTQPSSPQQNAAPPTPQQSNKANPKGKKEGKEPRKRATKKGPTAAAATPNSEAEPPPTPTPSTPITPVHPNSFNNQKGQAGPAQSGTSQPATSAPAQAPPIAPPQPDPAQAAPFASMDGSDAAAFNLDFGSLDSNDVLESFDFDSFLNTDENGGTGAFNFDPGLGYGNPDGVEAGTDA